MMTRNTVNEVKEYIDFLEISASDVVFAKKAWDYIYPHAEGALHEFYAHKLMRSFSKSIPTFNEFILTGKQIQYWDRLFTYGFDDKYFSNVNKVSFSHKKLNIPLSHYISSYGVILNEFEKILKVECADDPRLLEMLSGLRKFVFVDVSIVCKMYDAVLID
ncbi:protoglobin family protein [Labrenzia sp. PHM005]|uniref:protoglobin family protein n=1 Tax=Labrenzia sp. PHM005 TaxID=2590016 RepID=UPI0011402EEB|nr:protoglobin family protein [Labrenzia sp. PHM005]QDG77641.1 hypothetical protein FJ695_18190 [Labrenzia sp. PHM005]